MQASQTQSFAGLYAQTSRDGADRQGVGSGSQAGTRQEGRGGGGGKGPERPGCRRGGSPRREASPGPSSRAARQVRGPGPRRRRGGLRQVPAVGSGQSGQGRRNGPQSADLIPASRSIPNAGQSQNPRVDD